MVKSKIKPTGFQEMKKTNLLKWTAISEIVGAIAVVISLIFVVYSINQNTAALRLAGWEKFLDRTQRANEMIAESPDLAAIVIAGETNPEALSPEEYRRFTNYARMRFGGWEAIYTYHREGAIDSDTWNLWDSFYLDRFNLPGYWQVWRDIGSGYDKDFKTLLDSRLPKRDSQEG
jgi:hypothetical protein